MTKQITPSAPTEMWLEDPSTIKHPPPPPPRPAPPTHRRSGSDHTQISYPPQMPPNLPAQMFDPRSMMNSRSASNMTVVTTVSPNPPPYQPATQPPPPLGFLPTPPGSLRGISATHPSGRPSIPQIHTPPHVSTPVPNALPYSPCTSNNLNITPPPPNYYHSISTPTTAANNQHLTATQIGWRVSHYKILNIRVLILATF